MITFGLNSANILAQVNFGANSASILGIFLAVAGAALYFLRTVRPELSRDQDIFFAAVGLLCGFILIFQGWRLDPILQFGQLLLVGTTVYFAFESIRLRGIATEQAKRNTKIVDDDRPVSNNYRYSRRSGYRAEVDAELEPLPYDEDYYEEERPRARIPGSRDSRLSRRDEYENESPRRSERNQGERSSRRRQQRNSESYDSRYAQRFDRDDDWDTSSYKPDDDWESSIRDERGETEEREGRGGGRRPSRRTSNASPRSDFSSREEVNPRPRKRRRRPTNEYSPPTMADDDAMPVEYKPIEQSDDEPNNSTNLDDV
ncbi:MAG: Ycf66 family protein [Calothrix sp. MO_167.B42]|nr:Ycf66 family protein [Calothrix sp. MO_167.B42]